MLIVYVGADQGGALAAVQAREPDTPMRCCNPRYVREAADLEGDATRVVLVRESPTIRRLYEARGIPVERWDPAPSRTWHLTPHGGGFGWFDVVGDDGTLANARPLRKAEAEAMLRETSDE